MRFFVFIFAVVPLAGGTVVAAAHGNPFAAGIVLGAGLFFSGVLLLVAAHGAKRAAPRKADPAKIARLERELGMADPPSRVVQRAEDLADAAGVKGAARERMIAEYLEGYARGFAETTPSGSREGTTAWEGDRLLVYHDGHWRPAAANVVDTEAVPKTAHQFLGVKPPAERNVEDCPRPEGCVIAHPCRKCGADRGQACVGDPYAQYAAEAHRALATFHGAPTFGHKIAKPSGPPRKPSDARRSARP